MDYRREIDGLRALAVCAVILFHAGVDSFSGGFVGVDVFYVISGYLITSILLMEIERGEFSLGKFYMRRARRILPALFLVMLACLPFAWFWLLPSEKKEFSQSLLAVSAFSSNVLFWHRSGYFDTAAELKPLLHTWSLAVEEQYYLIFPLLLISFWKSGMRMVLIAFSGIFAASLALSQWATFEAPAAAFFLLPARAWELLVGAFVAFYLARDRSKVFGRLASELGGWTGLALICYSIFAYSKATRFPGFNAIVPTAGTALIILFSTPATTSGKFLGSWAFVQVGLISYGAYLWHHPLFAFAGVYTFKRITPELTVALVFLSFALGYLSFRFVETPFRSKTGMGRGQVFWALLLGSMFFAFVGLVGHIKNGFPDKHELINRAIRDSHHPGNLSATNINGYYKLHDKKPIEILFFGDSHAEQFSPLAGELDTQGLNVGFLSGGGCPPIPNLLDDLHPHCLGLFQRFNHILSIEPKVHTIVMAGCFNCYFIEQAKPESNFSRKFNYYYLHRGEKLFLRSGAGQTEAIAAFQRFLENLPSRYKPIVIGDNPLSESFNPSAILAHRLRGDSRFFNARYPNFSTGKFELSAAEISLDEKLRGATPTKASYISLLGIVCPAGSCNASRPDGSPIYRDDNHMRPAFVEKVVGPHLMKQLR